MRNIFVEKDKVTYQYLIFLEVLGMLVGTGFSILLYEFGLGIFFTYVISQAIFLGMCSVEYKNFFIESCKDDAKVVAVFIVLFVSLPVVNSLALLAYIIHFFMKLKI